jgi:hypothetical protein
MAKVVLSINAKCSDLYSHRITNKDGTITEYDGYVPSFMPGEHWGDYLLLDVDPYTGLILNWKKWKHAKKSKPKSKKKVSKK